MKPVLFAGIVLLASFYGSPYYFNHFQEVGGATYANIWKMLTEHPHDAALEAALRDAFNDGRVTSNDWQTILYTYNQNHGTFEGVPYQPGVDEETFYPKTKHKDWLAKRFNGGDHERAL